MIPLELSPATSAIPFATSRAVLAKKARRKKMKSNGRKLLTAKPPKKKGKATLKLTTTFPNRPVLFPRVL